MKTVVKVISAVALAAAVAMVAGCLAFTRGDIAYATLQTRYGAPTSHFADLPGGLRVHYRDEGDPKGPVLFLVHGFSASAADWDAWAARLGDDYRIIAIDLPGHGLTEAPRGYNASTDGFVATVDALASRLHLAPFVIVGNSMGGGVAWNYALAHPNRLRGLVLVDAAGWPHKDEGKNGALIFSLLRNPLARPLLKHLDTTGMARQGLDSAFVDKAMVTPALIKRYTDLARAPGHRDILLSIHSGPDNVATPARLAAIHLPTLVMVGAEDHLIPAADGKRFADAIPNATLIVYPGVGHVPMEQIPDRSAADLKAWLIGIGVKPAPGGQGR